MPETAGLHRRKVVIQWPEMGATILRGVDWKWRCRYCGESGHKRERADARTVQLTHEYGCSKRPRT